MKICPFCGKKNEDGNQYCYVCGRPMDGRRRKGGGAGAGGGVGAGGGTGAGGGDNSQRPPDHKKVISALAASVVVLSIILVVLVFFIYKPKMKSEPETTAVASDNDVETEPEPEPESESEPEPEPEQEQEQEAEPQSEPEQEQENEQESESEPELSPEPEPEVESDSGSGSETGNVTNSDTGQENDANSDAENEAAVEEKPSYDFPSGTLEYNGHHYFVYDDVDGDWDDALAKCLSRGGYLAVINDSGENEVLYEYMVGMGYDEAYFGITDRDSEGNWVYIAGDSSGFTDWGTNSRGVVEPNNADGGESHAMLDINMHDGHWNDAQFGRKIYTPDGKAYRNRRTYICEWGF